MGLRELFRRAPALDAVQARQYMQEHASGTYTLVDVRQPKEYEEAHLPGARLIPLPQLSDRVAELAQDQPLIVYCAIGGRSEMAARFLASRGFAEVYNLSGGIKAWRGETVTTPVGWQRPLLEAHAGLEALARLALQMERGLGRLYAELAAGAADPDVKLLLEELAGWEAAHGDELRALARKAGVSEAVLGAEADGTLVEGGFEAERLVADNVALLGSREAMLTLAMMVEAQALDLYLLFADGVTDEAARRLLRAIADEEKTHLARLGALLERRG